MPHQGLLRPASPQVRHKLHIPLHRRFRNRAPERPHERGDRQLGRRPEASPPGCISRPGFQESCENDLG